MGEIYRSRGRSGLVGVGLVVLVVDLVELDLGLDLVELDLDPVLAGPVLDPGLVFDLAEFVLGLGPVGFVPGLAGPVAGQLELEEWRRRAGEEHLGLRDCLAGDNCYRNKRITFASSGCGRWNCGARCKGCRRRRKGRKECRCTSSTGGSWWRGLCGTRCSRRRLLCTTRSTWSSGWCSYASGLLAFRVSLVSLVILRGCSVEMTYQHLAAAALGLWLVQPREED